MSTIANLDLYMGVSLRHVLHSSYHFGHGYAMMRNDPSAVVFSLEIGSFAGRNFKR